MTTPTEKASFHIDCFSSLDDLTPKQRKDPMAVLAALASAGRFSCFEASEYRSLAATINDLKSQGLIVLTAEFGYPWHGVTITEAGRALLSRLQGGTGE